MAKGPRYRVDFRRRREGKTNYKKRLALLKSRKQRLVLRLSNQGLVCQVVEYKQEGDVVLVSASSKDLKKDFGWLASGKSVPASYLVGLLCGVRCKKKKITDVILDTGDVSPVTGSRLFAALKGALDSGLNVPHGDGVFPPDERISGKSIQDYASELKKSNPDKYKSVFSGYIKNKLVPEKMVEHFEKTRKRIENA